MPNANEEACNELEREVTRLNARVAELDAESQTLRLTLQSAGDALISTDTEGKIVQMNAASEALTGFSQTEAIGQPLATIFRIVNEVTGEDVESLVERLLRERMVVEWSNHALLIAKDQSERPIASCGAPIRGVNGEVSGLVLIFRDRTATVATEQALRENEALFRATFERSTFGKSLTGLDGRIIKANQAFADMLGLSIQELQQVHFSQITHPDDIAEGQQCLRALLAGERSACRMEKRYQHRDGHLVFADVGVTLIRDQAGTPLHFVTGIVDVTKTRLAELTILASEMRYRRLFEAAKDGVLIVDADTGKIVDVNPFILELTGYSHEEFLGRHLWEIGPFKDIAPSKDLFAELQAKGYVRYEDLPLKSRDGRKIDVEFVSNVYRVEGQSVIQCNIRDITLRKQADKALREKEFLLSESQRLGHVGSWFWDMHGPASWSDEMYRLYGVSRETFIPTAESLVGLLYPDDRSAMLGWMAACAAGEHPGELEYRIVMPDGTVRYFLGRGQSVPGAGNETAHMAGTVQDITRQKEADVAREKLEAQLRASQKMEAIGSLAGGVAHDFNNLLSVILSYTGFAMDGVVGDDPLKDDLLEIKRAADRAAALTRQLLAFSRKQVLQPVALDLNQTARGLEKMLRRILGEDIDFVQVLALDLGRIMVDPGQIEQVFMNLVVNARDAMPEGGKLTIETSNVEIDEEYALRHVAVTPGSYVQLAITDTGCGMDEQTRARLFEPFFTTKAKGKGTGLGLSTVYGIIKQSGGNIWVYSELGIGTTFKVYLPRDDSATMLVTTKPPPVPRRSTGIETVLVVEDEEALRKVAERSLEGAGYRVLTASDGDEAMLTSARYPGDIHLLLTDVVMPRMSGRTLAQELAKARPAMKVLYMSGYTDDAIVHHGVLDAGTHFLAKPFTAADMTRKVREVLDLM
jgi:two-component system, cell cycle sensor histidine kinase and response regulator CckA